MKLFSSVSRDTSLAYLLGITGDNSHVQPSTSTPSLKYYPWISIHISQFYDMQYCYKRIFDLKLIPKLFFKIIFL